MDLNKFVANCIRAYQLVLLIVSSSKQTYHANHFRVDAFRDDASLTRNVFEHLVKRL